MGEEEFLPGYKPKKRALPEYKAYKFQVLETCFLAEEALANYRVGGKYRDLHLQTAGNEILNLFYHLRSKIKKHINDGEKEWETLLDLDRYITDVQSFTKNKLIYIIKYLNLLKDFIEEIGITDIESFSTEDYE